MIARFAIRVAGIAAIVIVAASLAAAQTAPTHGVRPKHLIIKNVMIVDGNGTPARGPYNVWVDGNVIGAIRALPQIGARTAPHYGADTVEIDGTGKYLLPGLINAHAHLQSNRNGHSLDGFEYNLKLWLANGITTVREVGSESDTGIVAMRDRSARGEIVAPRILAYPMLGGVRTPAEARARVQYLKKIGVDGVKITGIERDLMAAMEDEAHKLNLPVAHHAGVEETNVWDDIKFGTRSIEHWYGIPDGAIPDGRQNFPSSYNYQNESDRFRWAGRLWREADPKILDSALTALAHANIAWVPTLDIYEASRDLQRAQNQPWFKDYLHPSLEWYFKPDLNNHGSYFIGWSSTDEVYWKENYQIWMSALRDFERKGGVIGCGDDAGFIYELYGFALIREMELHQEAGFSTLKVIQHCTGNNAKILGIDDKVGRVRTGFNADLIVVDGNPLENLKVLYAGGTAGMKDGKEIRTNGSEWVIKDGIVYSGPQLLREVKEIVDKAKAGGSR